MKTALSKHLWSRFLMRGYAELHFSIQGPLKSSSVASEFVHATYILCAYYVSGVFKVPH